MEFLTHSGTNLYYDTRDYGHDKWLVVVHGINEYSDHYHFFEDLVKDQYNIFYFDLLGHGRSEGTAGDIDEFSTYSEMLYDVIQFMHKNFKVKEYALYGHSMGALIVANFVQDKSYQEFKPQKVILSAPPAGVPGKLHDIGEKIPGTFLNAVSQFCHRIPGDIFVSADKLSHDAQVAEDYRNDPLMTSCKLSLILKIAATFKKVFAHPLNIDFDFLCIIGSRDQVVTTDNLINYFAHVEEHRNFKIIEGGYHDLAHEVSEIREKYFNELKNFLLRN